MAESILVGKSASNGIAVGRAVVIQTLPLVIKRVAVTNAEAEVKRLHTSLNESKAALSVIREVAFKSLGEEKAAIFDAHLMVLDDPELIGETEHIIRKEKISASAAFQEVSHKFIGIFEAMENEYMRERAADIRDISDRVLRNLEGISIPDLSAIPGEYILICHDLSPSDTATLDPKKVLGILTEIGGKTGHSAIVARSLEIPAVLGLKKITELAHSGDWIVFDGESGKVTLRPDEKTRAMYLQSREKQLKDRVELQVLIGKPNQTLDGHTVALAGNIGSPQDVPFLNKYDASGVGLFRTEFLFMGHSKMPSEDEQFVAYKTVLEAMGNRPVTIRTLDIGGDKPVAYMDIGKEDNPFLGYRAIRYCLDHPEIFRTQLRALLRASAFGRLKIMFPMISSLDELLAAKEHLAAVRFELDAKKIPVGKSVPVGVMIEIPSAAVISDILAQNCDFLSIGTNDLIQYTIAVDRLNERVQNLHNPSHPGVLRLIQMTIRNGHEFGKTVSMCGEMAGNAMYLPLLLGMGLDEFSMAPPAILRSRQQLREWNLTDAQALAKKVLQLSRSSEIDAVLTQALQSKNAERSR